jgi:prophage antirepressor-like protein
LDVDEKGTAIVSTPGGEQEMLTVTEAGLYRLILGYSRDTCKMGHVVKFCK